MARTECTVAHTLHPSSIACGLIGLLMVLLAGQAAQGETLHVPDDYDTIQAAIDAAEDGDTILVAPGTYNEAIDFVGKAVHLLSEDGPEQTTIDAHGLDTSVVTATSGEESDTILEGFTITGGTAAGQYPTGGGMIVLASSPGITNCVFEGNEASSGGALSVSGTAENASNVTVTDTTFVDNTAVEFGGAVFVGSDSSLVLDSCTFTANSASQGGAVNVNSNSATAEIVNCHFENNAAVDMNGSDLTPGGGAVLNFGNTDPNLPPTTISNSQFVGNHSAHWGGAILDGSPEIFGETTTVENSEFIENSAEAFGGAVTAYEGQLHFISCAFENNSAGKDGGASYAVEDGSPTFEDSIFCGNSPDQIVGDWTDFSGNLFGPHCPIGDLNGDGLVGGADLGELLSQWGPCDNPDDCPADFNNDGVINGADLGVLLSNWTD